MNNPNNIQQSTDYLRRYLHKNFHKIQSALPYKSALTPELFAGMAFQEIIKNKMLIVLPPQKVLDAMLDIARLGLVPNGFLGQAYIVPYTEKGEKIAKAVIGYKGFIFLARSSGIVLRAQVVLEGDEFEFEMGSKNRICHKPVLAGRMNKPLVASYAIATLLDTDLIDIFSDEEIEQKRQEALKNLKNTQFSPWATHYLSMAMKCPLRRLFNQLPINLADIHALSQSDHIADLNESTDDSYTKEPLPDIA